MSQTLPTSRKFLIPVSHSNSSYRKSTKPIFTAYTKFTPNPAPASSDLQTSSHSVTLLQPIHFASPDDLPACIREACCDCLSRIPKTKLSHRHGNSDPAPLATIQPVSARQPVAHHLLINSSAVTEGKLHRKRAVNLQICKPTTPVSALGNLT